MHPMQQTNMAPPHQPQHARSHQHRNPNGQQILSMPAHQPQLHHMQHPAMSHPNSRQILMGISNNQNAGTLATANVGLKEHNTVLLQNSNSNVQQQQQQRQSVASHQNADGKKTIIEDGADLAEESSSNDQQQQTNATNPNLANTKEKTPMCLVNELARFNKIQHQYKLTNEQGPAHKKKFTVILMLGEEEYVAEGPSIKKAQHSAASEALTKTWYGQPPPKPMRAMRVPGKSLSGSGHLPPTVELNALAMKRGEPTVYTFRHAPPTAAPAPQQFVAHGFGNFSRMFNPRYTTYNRSFHPEPQGFYLVALKVGEREFIGRGMTGQAARHDAANRALELLRQLPLPEEVANNCALNENGACNSGIDDPNAEIKSPVSLVHETALKRGLSVSFDVVSESGKPHIRNFMTRCTVNDKVTIGEGSSKKVSKKRAAELMLEELKRLPPVANPLPNRSLRVKRKTPTAKKKSRNLIKVYQEPRTESEVAEEINPISRLVQIQQAKRGREPVYSLILEMGELKRREFVMEVSVGQHSAQGTGPNKKLAKRAAAEALLTTLGYSKPQPQPTKPSIKSGDSTDKENNEGKTRKVTFLEDDNSEEPHSHPTGGSIGRQLVPGILLMDNGQESKMSGGPSVQAVAEELRGQQQQQQPQSAGVAPKDQLKYLAQLLNFEVQFSDFPKGTYKEFLSLVSLNTDPPQVCHGHGPTKSASRDQAALTALRTLSKLGLDSVTSAHTKKEKISSGEGIHVYNQVKNNLINGALEK